MKPLRSHFPSFPAGSELSVVVPQGGWVVVSWVLFEPELLLFDPDSLAFEPDSLLFEPGWF